MIEQDALLDQIRHTFHHVEGETRADPQLVDRLIATARGRRRSLIARPRRHPWIAPLVTAGAVIAIAAGASIMAGSTTQRRVIPPSPTPPAGAATTRAPATATTSSAAPIGRPSTPTPAAPAASTRPHSTPAHAAPASSPATASPSTTTTPGDGPWTGPVLVITDHSLGAVTVGMTMAEAARAAGFASFTAIGDSVSIPTPWADSGIGRAAPGYPELYVSHWAGPSGAAQAFTCVGASGPSTAKQIVTTPEGVRLGDPASRIVAVYGSQAKYEPAPDSGMAPRAGYVIARSGYDLVFKLDDQQRIIAIAGGLAPLTPSECAG